jgi:Holliday junction DNA helicase RuvB
MSAEWENEAAGPDPTLRPERLAEDGDKALRPQGLNEFIGQEAARANLNVFIQSARQRGEAMDHALFHWSARSRQNHFGADHGA